MDQKDVDAAIEKVLGGITLGGWPKPIAELATLLTRHIAGGLHDVWAGLFDVKKALVNASNASSAQSAELANLTAALVKWTKVLAIATGALVFLTTGLLVDAIWSHLAGK